MNQNKNSLAVTLKFDDIKIEMKVIQAERKIEKKLKTES